MCELTRTFELLWYLKTTSLTSLSSQEYEFVEVERRVRESMSLSFKCMLMRNASDVVLLFWE